MENLSKEMAEAVLEVERALISKNYTSIGSESRNSRLSAKEIEQAIKEYGGLVTQASESEISKIKAIKVTKSNYPRWSVDYDLWIDNKLSDLTVSLTLTKEGKRITAVVDDIHVL
ncbi:MAG: hypothetical protein HYS86_03510 [Candidatus Chisholmbacteria bacterium]|nr:hypothetical protein [Candidatus Chisholmbacteria bacterium]